ncbi:hypothetical protein NLI96_g11619 [Meripilus lineatus]|uniref:Uncharacterized protein n=1 Tax=Meripilus lineatus TaxID=2056292 RepID=A0AAD5YAN3_9APHY|nr:hypothetical protein NLI96_g11619 [Physisporinus lineatus]
MAYPRFSLSLFLHALNAVIVPRPTSTSSLLLLVAIRPRVHEPPSSSSPSSSRSAQTQHQQLNSRPQSQNVHPQPQPQVPPPSSSVSVSSSPAASTPSSSMIGPPPIFYDGPGIVHSRFQQEAADIYDQWTQSFATTAPPQFDYTRQAQLNHSNVLAGSNPQNPFHAQGHLQSHPLHHSQIPPPSNAGTAPVQDMASQNPYPTYPSHPSQAHYMQAMAPQESNIFAPPQYVQTRPLIPVQQQQQQQQRQTQPSTSSVSVDPRTGYQHQAPAMYSDYSHPQAHQNQYIPQAHVHQGSSDVQQSQVVDSQQRYVHATETVPNEPSEMQQQQQLSHSHSQPLPSTGAPTHPPTGSITQPHPPPQVPNSTTAYLYPHTRSDHSTPSSLYAPSPDHSISSSNSVAATGGVRSSQPPSTSASVTMSPNSWVGDMDDAMSRSQFSGHHSVSVSPQPVAPSNVNTSGAAGQIPTASAPVGSTAAPFTFTYPQTGGSGPSRSGGGASGSGSMVQQQQPPPIPPQPQQQQASGSGKRERGAKAKAKGGNKPSPKKRKRNDPDLDDDSGSEEDETQDTALQPLVGTGGTFVRL